MGHVRLAFVYILVGNVNVEKRGGDHLSRLKHQSTETQRIAALPRRET